MDSLAAIAHPTRRRIVELLAKRSRSSGELAQQFDMSAPAISQHLNILRSAGLITTQIEGQSRIQSLNPHGLDELEAWLHRTREFWSRSLDALERELRTEDEKSGNKGKSLAGDQISTSHPKHPSGAGDSMSQPQN